MIRRSLIGKLIAYSTLLVFFMPWSVQIIHIFTAHHHILHCDAHEEYHWHDEPDKCEICAFTFAQFIDRDKINNPLIGVHSTDESDHYISNVYFRFTKTGFYLRAPPVA